MVLRARMSLNFASKPLFPVAFSRHLNEGARQIKLYPLYTRDASVELDVLMLLHELLHM